MIKRTFYPGEEWIYIKIYMNAVNSDEFILSIIDPYIRTLKSMTVISEWFYIRYYDPDFHLRLRLKLLDLSNMNNLLSILYGKIERCFSDLVYKIELSTYVREIERYGLKKILTAESVFSIDSDTVLELIKFSKKTEVPRWKIAILLIDCIFNEWEFDLECRFVCMRKLSDSFKLEFGYNMYNSKSLNKIYARYKKDIELLLIGTEDESISKSIDKILLSRLDKVNFLIRSNGNFRKRDITSYIHMSMNRLFKLDNRVYELVLYEFLKRAYKSLLIQRKMYDENYILKVEHFFL